MSDGRLDERRPGNRRLRVRGDAVEVENAFEVRHALVNVLLILCKHRELTRVLLEASKFGTQACQLVAHVSPVQSRIACGSLRRGHAAATSASTSSTNAPSWSRGTSSGPRNEWQICSHAAARWA